MPGARTRTMVLTALLAALTAAGAFFRIPLGVTSVTLQFFFTALAGVLLGAKYGALSQGVYVLLGLCGLPVFTQGGGPGYLTLPSFGFLLGLIPAAAVVGWLTRRDKSPRRVFAAALLGLGVLYMAGLPYMALILNVYLGQSLGAAAILMSGMVIYLPGDLLKILGVAALSRPLCRALS